MSIFVKDDVFRIDTINTTYAFCVRHGELIHLYYGERLGIGDDLTYLISDTVRSGAPYRKDCGNTFTPENLLSEVSVFDTGDFRVSSLKVLTGDGVNIGDFRFDCYQVFDGRKKIPSLPCGRGLHAQTLCVRLKSRKIGVILSLYYCVYEKTDIIVRYMEVENTNDERIFLEKAASALLDFEYGDFEMLTLQGVVANERHACFQDMPTGKFSINSVKGISSHSASPFIALGEKGANENKGNVYALNLVYSGNFCLETERLKNGRIRVVLGIDSETLSYELKRGECFYTPEAIITFSEKGYNGASQRLHEYIREELMPERFAKNRRPVVLNTWEAFGFDICEEKLLRYAKCAVEAGVDTLVIDDGWFSTRRNDRSGLGDWTVAKKIFPSGLKSFVKKLKALGLNTGIWIEPEMANPDSELFRTHPDWVLGGNDEIQSRNQLVLDMTNPAVVNHIFDSLCKVLDGAGFSYVKWDMNRYICPYRSGYTARAGEVAYKYMLGVYSLMERLTKRYPEILFENCAGGGGRFDAGMMAYSPQIWASDNTDPFERSYIQCGTSYAYPVSSISCHVTASRNGGTKEDTSMGFRYGVATNGVLGYELDLFKCSEEEKKTIRAQIEAYRREEELMLKGDFYRLRTPERDGKYYAYAMVSKDKKQALIAFHTLSHFLNGEEIFLKVYGLDDNVLYVGEKGVWSGKTLRCAGLKIPMPERSGDSFRIFLKAR